MDKRQLDSSIEINGALDVVLDASISGALTVAGATTITGAITGASVNATTITSGALSISSGVTSCATGAGTAATGVTAAEYGDGMFHKTVLTFSKSDFTITEAGTAGWGTMKLYDFPLGALSIIGASGNMTIDASADTTNIAADGSGDFSVGTTATEDATLSSTDADLIPSGAFVDPFVSSVGTGFSYKIAPGVFDGTSTAKDAILNVRIDSGDVTATTNAVTISGEIVFHWVNAGAPSA